MPNTTSRAIILALTAAAFFVLPGADPRAQEDEPGVARSCVQMASVRRTRIVDDRSILFYLRGGGVYHNQLGSQCHGLKREGRFTYDVVRGELCASAQIAVLRELGGRWMPTAVCQLGLFVPISLEEAEDVIDAAEVSNTPRRRRARIDVRPAELPPADEAAAPPSAGGSPE